VSTLDAYLDRTAADLTLEIGDTKMPGVQTYVGLPTGGVAILRAWYATAIDWCHTKLSERDFVDSAGASISPPDACVLGVYEFVRVLKEYHERSSILARKVKTGAREEEYDIPGTAGRISAAALAAWPYLEPYCEDVTLFATGGGG
jgi:hypothetical protein